MNEQLTLLDMPTVQKLSKSERNGVNTIYWNEHYALISYQEENDLSKRMAVVFLIQTNIGSYAEVASLLGYSESNLYVIMRSYREKGLLGLMKKKTGPKDPKVTREIQNFIVQTEGLTLNEMVKRVQEQYGVQLSDWTISAVKRGEIHQDQLGLFSDNMLNSLLVDDECETEESDVTSEQSFTTTNLVPTAKTLEEQGNNNDDSDLVNEPVQVEFVYEEREAPIHADDLRESIHNPYVREKAVVESRYAGGFLLLPFLQQIDPSCSFQNIQEMFDKVSENVGKRAYGLSEFMYTLLFLLWFRFSSIEDFKFVQPREFGVLLGRDSAPSVKTLRRYFPSILDGEIIEEWMLQLVRRYIQLDVIQLGTLYFDGHKIPYYGHADLPKGYLSSKRLPAKLIEQVFANDRSGRPVFLRVHDTSLSFKDTVLSMIEDAQALWEERGIREPLVVAFDRELYDTSLFAKLDEIGVLYITWRKWDKPLTVEQLSEEIYDLTQPGREKSDETKSIRYQAWRRKIKVKDYELEAISFLSTEKAEKDPKRTPSTLVTNADKFYKSEKYPDYVPPPTGDLIDILCQRWRQENYFRYSKHGQNLDYNPRYEKKERHETRTVANPKLKELKHEVQKLKKEIDKLNDKITIRLTKRKKKDKPLGDLLQQKSMKKLVQLKEQAEKRIQSKSEEISGLPERVPVEKSEHSSLELDLEGKQFLDVLRIVMHNAEQMLLDVFKRCYSDPRDIHKVLRAIANQGGTVEEQRDIIMVELFPLHIPAHRRAAEELCTELNATNTKMAHNGKKILFTVKK